MSRHISYPKQIAIARSEEKLHITYKWRSAETIVYFLISIAMVLVAITYVDTKSTPTPMGLLATILIVGSALALCYYTAAFTLNKTQFIVQNNIIEVKTGPIFWFGTGHFKVDEVKEISSRRQKKREDGYFWSTYEVNIVQNYNRKSILYGNFNTLKQAEFVHLELEKSLNIASKHRKFQ